MNKVQRKYKSTYIRKLFFSICSNLSLVRKEKKENLLNVIIFLTCN